MDNPKIVKLFESVIESRKNLCREYKTQIKDINKKKNRRVRKQNDLKTKVNFYVSDV